MEEYQARLLQEKKELDEKIKKLNRFIATTATYEDMGHCEQVLLCVQLKTMVEYSNILNERILTQ